MREEIKNVLKETLSSAGVSAEGVHLEHPADSSHGDYSTNSALRHAPQVKKAPKEFAEEIVRHIAEHQMKGVEKVLVAGPGFINFYLSKDFFVESVKRIADTGDQFGENAVLSDKKIMVEYTDPNPFKEFHIGHLMSNAIGESISQILEFSGADVKRANYQGDVGLHVAKAIWGKMQTPSAFWGEAYAYGAQNYEQNKKEIDEINKKIYEKNDPKINALYDEGRKESLGGFEKMYELLGTKFDFYFFESESGSIGLKIVTEHPDVFEESDGAIVFRGEKFDPALHTRVFVTKDGFPTYEAKELGLAKIKNEKWPHDVSISITGNEIKDYFKVVLKAMEKVLPEEAKKVKHIPHGMLRLPTGKMSSRTGDVVSAESLCALIKQKVLERMKDSNAEDKEKIADKIAVGAVKYSVLKSSTGSDIVFDFEKSISFDGDSGPYLQYTYARAKSVLRNAEGRGHGADSTRGSVWSIERLLYRFPEIVERALNEYEPHHIATYLTEVAGAFNAFYAKERIIDSDDAPYRLLLTEATSTVLKNGLKLLGIEAPERM